MSKDAWDFAGKVLLLVAGSVITYFATVLQGRRNARERRATTAAAIRAEVQRIRLELVGVASTTPEAGARVPAIHSWMQGVIVSAAEIHPSIVTNFIQVERALNDIREARPLLVGTKGDYKLYRMREMEQTGIVDPKYRFQLEARVRALEEGIADSCAEAFETLTSIEDIAARAMPNRWKPPVTAQVLEIEAESREI
jgi:hypothetical protein